MADRQAHVGGVAGAVVQRDRAAEHPDCAGWLLLVDVPGDLLNRVKVERVEVEHAHVGLVTLITYRCRGCVDLDVAVVPGGHHECGGRPGCDQTEQPGERGEQEKQTTAKAG